MAGARCDLYSTDLELNIAFANLVTEPAARWSEFRRGGRRDPGKGGSPSGAGPSTGRGLFIQARGLALKAGLGQGRNL